MAATLCSSSAASAAASLTRRAPNNKSRTTKTTTRGFGDAHVNHSAKNQTATSSSITRRLPLRRRRVVTAAASGPEETVSAAGLEPPTVARALEYAVEMACGKCVTRVEAAVVGLALFYWHTTSFCSHQNTSS
jgi:hypothetical protein